MTKEWRILIGTSMTHEYYVKAETYEEATKKAEEVIATGATDTLTLSLKYDDINEKTYGLIEQSVNHQLESVQEVKGKM